LVFHQKSFDNPQANGIRLGSRPTLRDISTGNAWCGVLLRQIEALDFDRYTTEWVHLDVLERATNSLRRCIEVRTLENVVTSEGNLSDPLSAIRTILDKFRDVESPDRWPEILYLAKSDPDLHKQLCCDLDEAHSSLVAQNWKAATVVSASVMEALLSWWIKEKKLPDPPDKLTPMIDFVGKSPHCLFDPPATMDPKYDRSEAESRKGAAMCAANYRNLIHADKATRLQATCSRASAWQTFGATLMVAEAVGRNL
jgi:hypothetical protein